MLVLNTMKWTSACLVTAFLVACGDGSRTGADPDASDTLKAPVEQADGGVMSVSGKLFSIPSPVETALLLRKLNMPYGKELPLSTEDVARFVSPSQRALALGIFGADLAYVTIHKDGQRAMKVLQTVERISSELDLSNAFDKELSERFKKSLNSEDSLLRFTGVAFRSAQEYLKNNSRENVSAWVLAGGWVESMYLTMAQMGEVPEQAVAQRIAEQSRTLKDLVALLEASDKEGTSAALVTGLKELLAVYQGVKGTYQFQPPTVDAAAKTTYINSTSSVSISPETVRAISDKVKAIRTSIIA
jgi:hypothetical protein